MSRLGRMAALVAAVATLAGCGNINPGVAVQAGDESISVREVDDLTADYCEALSPNLKGAQGGPQTVPQRYLRRDVAGVMAMRLVAEQLAEEYDVEPGDAYEDQVTQIETGARALDEDVRDSLVTLQLASPYVDAIQAAVGEQLLADEGTTGAEQADQIARGKEAFAAWIDDNDVDIDPEFGLALDNGDITPVDTSLSVAVGENAKAGANEEAPDPDYASSLPAAHTCD